MSRPDDPPRPDAAEPAVGDAAPGTGAEPADGGAGPRRRSRSGKRRSWARRKRLGRITVGAVVLVLAAGLATVVLTWDSGRTPPSAQAATAVRSTAPAPATTATPVPPAPGRPGVAVATTVRGEVTAVGDGQFTMQTRTGATYTVVVTAATTFARDREFSDYQVGSGLAVDGSLDGGVLTATTISPAAPN